jgi:RNA polymerase sigma-70 factor, ECF subfamily
MPPTTPPSDADTLVQQMRAGDLAALDGIARRYGARLIGIALRCCRSREEAEDAVQDTLLQAGQGLQAWHGEGDPMAWLGTMVSNRCRRLRRARRDDHRLHEPLDEQRCRLSAPSPEARASTRELAAAVGGALESLERTDQLLVILAAEGWTGPELAAEFDLEAPAIRQRLHRARRHLTKRLSHIER